MKQRHYFTKAITFDVDLLLHTSKENQNNSKKSADKFDDGAVFNVENLIEK